MLKIIAALLLTSFNANSAVQVDALGGLSYANQTDISSTVYSNLKITPKSYMGFGLLTNLKPSKKGKGLGLSFGALYVQGGARQEFRLATTDFFQNALIPYIQVPVAINYWFGKSFSFGVGGYYGWAYGSMQTTGYMMVGGVPLPSNYITPVGQNGYKSHDYGIIAQAQLKFDLSKKIDFMLVAIYEKGLFNIFSNPGTNITNNIILALAGLGYTF